MRISPKLIVLLFIINNNIYAQSIYDKIENIYNSKSTNIDSIKKVILSIPDNSIDIYKLQNIIEKKKVEDTSFLCRVKTFYFIKQLFISIKQCDNIEMKTRVFYRFQLQEFYVKLSPEDYTKNYKKDYNSIFRDDIYECFSIKEFYEYPATLKLYREYLPTRPQLLQNQNKLRFFRLHNISLYNDLILKYILKSPDSVDWNQRPFIRTLPYEAVYTLAYFNDERVIPYLEKAVTVQGLDIREDIFNYFVSPFEGNEGEKIQLSLCKALLDRGDVLARKEVRSRATYKNITYSILDYVVVRCKKIFPQQYEQMKNIQDEKERLLFLKNLVDKRLQELD